MNLLATDILGRTVQQWGVALLTTIALWTVFMAARRILVSRLSKIAARTTNQIDDFVVDMIRRARPTVLFVIACWPALGILHAGARSHHVAHVIAVIAATIQAAIWGQLALDYLLVKRVSALQKEDPESATTLGGVTLLARAGLWMTLAIIALDNLGVNVTTLVAGLGIGGVAIALALQNILGDLFASLSIALDKPFVVGDFVVVGDLAGTVERVGLKTTRVKSLTGEQLIFSNTDLLGSRIHNFKRMAERRILFSVGVTYETAYAQVQKIPGMIEAIIRADSRTRFDRAHFLRYDDFALTFEVVYFVLSPDYNTYMDVQQRINLAIFEQFTREKIDFAYPTRTLYVKNDTGALAAQDAPRTA
jgi:small-conductance mechanosensitive channel